MGKGGSLEPKVQTVDFHSGSYANGAVGNTLRLPRAPIPDDAVGSSGGGNRV